jgi:hypothetical protein
VKQEVALLAESDFCNVLKFKRVGKEESLIQTTFWRDKLQLPFSGIVERQYMLNFVRPEMPTDYLYAKVRPFSEEFKARLAKSRN